MNKIITLFFVIGICIPSISQELTDSLLIYYPFNGNTLDQSGNNFEGLFNAEFIDDQFTNPENAVSFNGVNQYIDLPNDPKLKPQFPVSFSYWVQFDDLEPNTSTIFTTDFGPDQHSGVWMNVSGSGKLAINYGDASGGSSSPDRRTKIGTTDLQTGEWYHIVGIIRSGADMDIFINCENDGGSYSGSATSLGYTNQPGSIGRKDLAGVPVYYFDGAIDNFRYWNRIITEDEINLLCEEVTTNTKQLEKKVDRAYIYPNPVYDILNIETEGETYSKIQISNLLGQHFGEYEFVEELNVQSLPEGGYILRLINEKENESKTFKFLKI